MTNTKAQVGDLIRIVNPIEGVSDPYTTGDILEVTRRRNDLYVYALFNGVEELIADQEYVIHRKAGEEDSLEYISESTKDDVNSPQHYTQGRVEVIDIIEDAVQGADPFEAVCQANILKYIMRYRHKNGITDINKAIWYANKLIAHEQRKIDGK